MSYHTRALFATTTNLLCQTVATLAPWVLYKRHSLDGRNAMSLYYTVNNLEETYQLLRRGELKDQTREHIVRVQVVLAAMIMATVFSFAAFLAQYYYYRSNITCLAPLAATIYMLQCISDIVGLSIFASSELSFLQNFYDYQYHPAGLLMVIAAMVISFTLALDNIIVHRFSGHPNASQYQYQQPQQSSAAPLPEAVPVMASAGGRRHKKRRYYSDV